MAKIIEMLKEKNGSGVYHFRYGYDESPMSLLLFYNLDDLNDPKFDFTSKKVKRIKYEKSKLSKDKKIVWYEDSIKEADFTATADVAAGTLDIPVSITSLQVGDELRNKVTGETMVVTAIPSAGTVTVDANVNGVTNGDQFIRFGFAKTYGEYSAKNISFNDATPYDNYIQFVSAEIPEDKTDILENNLSRLFYDTTDDYLKELYAEASRIIVKTIVYSLYAGRPAAITLPSSKVVYTAGGMEYYIPASASNINIRGASDAITKRNFRQQVMNAYKSGVSGLYKKNRLMFFCNSAMAAQISDLYEDTIRTSNDLNHFGIHIQHVNLNGYKIAIVDDNVLDELYGDVKTGFIIDIEGIAMFNLMEDVINKDGKSVSALGASKIFVPAQTTPEMRTVMLWTHFSWIFKNVGSGVFRKLIYV